MSKTKNSLMVISFILNLCPMTVCQKEVYVGTYGVITKSMSRKIRIQFVIVSVVIKVVVKLQKGGEKNAI